MMNERNILLLIKKPSFFLCLFYFFLLGQVIGQEKGLLRGEVKSMISSQPLVGASISFNKSSYQTDQKGNFRISDIPAGRYEILIKAKGYEAYRIPDLIVGSGKEVVLDIRLEEGQYEMDEVVISAPDARQLDRVSSRSFTVEETQRFAATYFDPARFVTALPGVIQNNDQANNLVVRGNSPNGIAWKLEGVDIANPNHLTNGGTFTDRLSQSGGSTIILSTQLLGNSRFLNGAFDAKYGNALSGVFDMTLRRGNNENHEFTAQAGLIGVDLSAEGPFSSNSKASYLVNYRYSTVGLLSLMGIPLGDEEITYQDLSFNLVFPDDHGGTFTIFGIGGLSSNIFTGAREGEELITQKDRFDINFGSDMGAIGMTYKRPLGIKSFWKSSVALSSLKSTRDSYYLDDQFNSFLMEADLLSQTKLAANSSVLTKLNKRNALEAGVDISYNRFQLDFQLGELDNPGPLTLLARQDADYLLFQPFANWQSQLNSKLRLDLGVRGTFTDLNDDYAIEPRASLKWSPSRKNTISIAYGRHSMLQLAGTYFTTVEIAPSLYSLPNQNLDLTKAHHIVLSYRRRLQKDLYLTIEPYYQHLYDVPIVDREDRSFSVLNLLEGYVFDSLTNAGTGRNYGVDFSLEKVLRNDIYFMLSGSVYESKYTAGDGIERDTRFNGNYVFSFTGGKEIHRISKKGKDKTLGLNARLVYQGGFREMPINTFLSTRTQRTIFDESNGFTEELPDYFRLDLRVSWRKDKPNSTHIFAIDIQNATNQKNLAFRSYDFVQKKVVERNQLGIIPLISYKWEF